MRQGIIPAGGTDQITKLSNILLAFEPGNRREEIIHTEALGRFNRVVELRQSRFANVRT